jgi:co-chaperonin GroES (HSP10)
MIKIEPKDGILLIRKHKNTALSQDMVVEESDADKNLISGEVLVGNGRYPAGTSIIFGRYAIFKLIFKGEDYFFIDENDIISIFSYKE